MIDINELRRKLHSGDITDHVDIHTNVKQTLTELLDRLEAAENSDAESLAMYRKARDERDALRTKIEVAHRDYNALEGYYTELAEKLAAVNHAVDEAYQRGYATGQEEVAAELEFAKQEIANLHDDISEWMDKCDALRTTIEQMEQQEPVAEWVENRFHHYPQLVWKDSYRAIIGEKLYALPGAKGEEK